MRAFFMITKGFRSHSGMKVFVIMFDSPGELAEVDAFCGVGRKP